MCGHQSLRSDTAVSSELSKTTWGGGFTWGNYQNSENAGSEVCQACLEMQDDLNHHLLHNSAHRFHQNTPQILNYSHSASYVIA